MTGPALTPLVFERRLPARMIVDLLLGLAVGIGLLSVQSRLADLAVQVAAGLPAPGEQLTRSMVLAGCQAWLVVWLAAVGFVLPRRFGRAELWPDVLVLWSPLLPVRWAGLAIPLPDVRERVVTAHGVRVWSRALDPVTDRVLPLVIPAEDEAAAARIHALLDPPAPGMATGAAAGRAVPAWVFPLFVGWVAAWVFTSPLVFALSGPLMGPGGAAAIAAIVWFVARSRRYWGRVHAGVVTLSVLQHVVPWGRVRACAIAGGRLAVEVDDGRRLTTRIGVGAEAEALRTAAAARLAAAGAPLLDALPAWAVQRRRGALLAATFLLLPFVPLLHAVTRRATLTRVDHVGQTFHVLYRVWDGTPERVVMVIDPEVARVGTATLAARGLDDAAPVSTGAHVDLVAGRARLADGSTVELPSDATVLVLGPAPGALRTSRRPLDASAYLASLAPGPMAERDRTFALLFVSILTTLESMNEEVAGGLVTRVFPRTEDELLVAVRDGRAARRCVSLSAPDGQLLLRLELGQVRACAIFAPKSAPGTLLACRACALAPLDGQLLVRRASGEEARGRLPTWDEAQAAVAALEGGATVERATRGWAPPP